MGRQVGPWKNPPAIRDEGSLFPLIRWILKQMIFREKDSRKPIWRWHQTLDFGYLPNPGSIQCKYHSCSVFTNLILNPEQDNMFLAMSLDTYRIKDGEGIVCIKIKSEVN